MREIVTIQVGNYANFIGSHFWNFQDELLGLAESPESDQVFKNHSLDMDVLYRTGETQQGLLTYTPRMVSVNFQGSLGSVSSRGSLYNQIPTKNLDVKTCINRAMLNNKNQRSKSLPQSCNEAGWSVSFPVFLIQEAPNIHHLFCNLLIIMHPTLHTA
ncbi:hypothetical protein HAX54_007784 [Datura stramonium]|uniref:Misato Segment II tubulin-like domain-containing protein n=1 Tax=Datura stramonium TaxID=4076 RepID=A0ABS8RI40_DATST|nr:hypothetical protein [Datura stramonium]